MKKIQGLQDPHGATSGDTSGVATDDDAIDVEVDDDYVVDNSDAHRAWDLGPTQDWGPIFNQNFFLVFSFSFFILILAV